MADENVPASAPIRFDDQILPFATWEEFVQAIQTFLVDKANLGIPTKNGKKTKPHVIPYCRFTKLIIYYLWRIHNIHQRSGSPLNLAEDDLSLGNLKFIPKGEIDEVFGMQIPKELITNNIRNDPYYNVYLEMVAKHNKKIAAEEGGKEKSASKADKPKKPVPSKQSKPAPAMKPKVAQKKPSESSPAKHPKRGKVQKVRKGKNPLKLIDEDEEVYHVPKPQDAKTGADTDITTNIANTEVLYTEDVQCEEISHTVVLEEKTVELDEGRARSDPGKTPKSRPPPEHGYMDKDQDRPNPGQSHEALARPNPEPMHVTSLLQWALSSMKNLDDAFTFDDQFLNDKPIKEEPTKTTMETKAESMVSVPIHQASTLVLPLSTPIIDILPPKLVSSPLQELVIAATTEATTTTLPLPPPPQQQSTKDSLLASRVSTIEQRCAILKKKHKLQDQKTQALSSRIFTLELRDLPHKINQTINEVVKEAVHVALQAPLRYRFRELPEADMKEIRHQRIFESVSYKSLPEHVALYENLEASMERANRDEFLAEKDKSQKRRRDDQDLLPPPPDSDLSKKKRHDSDASGSIHPPAPQSSVWKTSDTREAPPSSSMKNFVPYSEQPVKDVPIPDDVNISDSEDIDIARLSKIKTRPDWLKPVPKTRLVEAYYGPCLRNYGVILFEKKIRCIPVRFSEVEVRLIALNSELQVFQPFSNNSVPNPHVNCVEQVNFVESRQMVELALKMKQIQRPLKHLWNGKTRTNSLPKKQPVEGVSILDDVNILDSEDTDTAHLPKIKTRPDWLKPRPEEDRPKTPKPDWIIPPTDIPEAENNWADALAKSYKDLEENKLLSKNFRLEELVPSLWIESERDYNISAAYDRNDQKKMMRETEVCKFNDGTLNRILDKLDHMVKDFKLFKYNLGMETRIWFKDDKRRSKEFMENIRVILKYHSKDGNPARANIKQALGRRSTYIISSFQDRNKYEHVGLQDTRPQDGERSQDDDQRLDLADDLNKAQDHI
uniref:Histone deacetylase 14 n=1 Tax=Tanacetum cinerariifolium TaxID=118510 RepID=A0A6L2MEB9_TANCI|nr:hypothetical protein [Tanacetum cinerariifolium]